MKVALVHAVPIWHTPRFAWRWRGEDGLEGCGDAFEYFFECCEDARKAGFRCKFVKAAPDVPAPSVAIPERPGGGAQHR